MRPATCCVLILIATVVATVLRVPQLEQRPMHTDEAVHGYKFGELLQENGYKYDPFEYHGPTLNYFTLVPALLSGAGSISTTSEITLRLVPVFFGLLLILLLIPLQKALGPWTVVTAAFFTATSPAMVYYSRYYIMEILLVCFTAGAIVAGYFFSQNQSKGWAVLTGICIGLTHSTKETCIIAWGCLGTALGAIVLLNARNGQSIPSQLRAWNWTNLGIGIAAATLTSVAFFSSFGANPAGIWDSIATYSTYFNRAAAGESSPHEHPWHYYLGLLANYQFADGPSYTEGLILILFGVGLIPIITGKGVKEANLNLLRFIAVYTILMTVLYSFIRYKTPWCLLGFYHGMIIIAGVGAAFLIQHKLKLIRMAAVGIAALGTIHLAYQAHSSSFTYDSDARNPFVYAHTGNDIFTVVDRVKAMIEAHPDAPNTPVQVACPGGDYWPLPWYLRDYNVEYSTSIDTNSSTAPIILIQPALEEDLMVKLYEVPPPGQKEMYMFLFYAEGEIEYRELRPQIELRGFVKKDLWDLHNEKQEELETLLNSSTNNPAAPK